MVIGLVLITGCAVKKDFTAIPPQISYVKTTLPGIYHRVKKGETLWRISLNYKTNLAKLVDFNKIPDASKIEVGQKIFIPDSLRQAKTSKQFNNLKMDFTWPNRGKIISYFNQKKINVKNHGIDILAKKGSYIYASASGKVIFTTKNMRGHGKAIIIQHKSPFSTVYTHHQKNLVKTGDFVKHGQAIARAGSTGRAERCIVHFELRKNNKAQNPLYYLP